MDKKTEFLKYLLEEYPYVLTAEESAAIDFILQGRRYTKAARLRTETGLTISEFRNIVINSFGLSFERVAYSAKETERYAVTCPKNHQWPERNTSHPCGLPNTVVICQTQCYLAERCEAAKRYGIKQKSGIKKLNLRGEAGLSEWQVRPDDKTITLEKEACYASKRQ